MPKKVELNSMIKDQLDYWDYFRHPDMGVWCTQLNIGASWSCGRTNSGGHQDWMAWYHHSGTIGWALIIDCARVEIGELDRSVAEARILQTLRTFINVWPWENNQGFMNWMVMSKMWKPDPPWVEGELRPVSWSHWSVTDSALVAGGALFAGNYFGGEIMQLAQQIANSPNFGGALGGSRSSSY